MILRLLEMVGRYMALKERSIRGGREALIVAAIRLFAIKGYTRASTREICKAAGITKPVLYYHFGSKDNLYRELIVDYMDEYQKSILHMSQMNGGIRNKLIRILYNDILKSRQDPYRTRMILRMIVDPSEEHCHFISTKIKELYTIIESVFQKGIKSGELRGDPRRLASVLMGFSAITILQNVFIKGRPFTRQNSVEFVDLLLQNSKAISLIPRSHE